MGRSHAQLGAMEDIGLAACSVYVCVSMKWGGAARKEEEKGESASDDESGHFKNVYYASNET